MNGRSQTHLAKELTAAGASAGEAHELAMLASNLTQLNPKRSQQRSVRSRFKILLPVGFTGVAGIVVGMALVIFSQTVLPGSRLYAIQKLSDHVAVSVDPSYRGTVMMKRAEEVKQLIASHAAPSVVLATLSDYKTEASVYKTAPSNYAAFEYCKDNLQQAAAIAPSPERQAIVGTLNSLSAV